MLVTDNLNIDFKCRVFSYGFGKMYVFVGYKFEQVTEDVACRCLYLFGIRFQYFIESS